MINVCIFPQSNVYLIDAANAVQFIRDWCRENFDEVINVETKELSDVSSLDVATSLKIALVSCHRTGRRLAIPCDLEFHCGDHFGNTMNNTLIVHRDTRKINHNEFVKMALQDISDMLSKKFNIQKIPKKSWLLNNRGNASLALAVVAAITLVVVAIVMNIYLLILVSACLSAVNLARRINLIKNLP